MTNVWKIGSTWGDQGRSLFEMFMDYDIVFVGGTEEKCPQGDYRAVRPGDLFLIANGETPIAIAKALGKFQTLKESGIELRKKDEEDFFAADTLLCRAEIRLIAGKDIEKAKSWSFDGRKRFCRNNGSASEVRKYWDNMLEDKHGKFDINSRTVSLLPSQHSERDYESLFNERTRYRIPIYQRPYSWGNKEIERLFQEIACGIPNDEPLFMGTIQLSAPLRLDPRGAFKRYDIIDGQQRLTTFWIMSHSLYSSLHFILLAFSALLLKRL